MGTKRIKDLTQRANFSSACLVPVDDPTKTWYVTAAQIADYVGAGGSSGQGFGGINLLTSNPDDWVSDEPVETVVAEETNSDEAPLNAAGGICFRIDSSDGNGNVGQTLKMPEPFRGKSIQIRFWLKPGTPFGDVALEVLTYTDPDYSTGLDQVTLTPNEAGTTFIPGDEGIIEFVATFMAPADKEFYRIRFGGFGEEYHAAFQRVYMGPLQETVIGMELVECAFTSDQFDIDVSAFGWNAKKSTAIAIYREIDDFEDEHFTISRPAGSETTLRITKASSATVTFQALVIGKA